MIARLSRLVVVGVLAFGLAGCGVAVEGLQGDTVQAIFVNDLKAASENLQKAIEKYGPKPALVAGALCVEAVLEQVNPADQKLQYRIAGLVSGGSVAFIKLYGEESGPIGIPDQCNAVVGHMILNGFIH